LLLAVEVAVRVTVVVAVLEASLKLELFQLQILQPSQSLLVAVEQVVI
jgi:hypothetical protein